MRVDVETGNFLKRHWLGLAGRGFGRGSRSSTLGRRKFDFRIHAGWLAQTLKPMGVLAAIPEDEVLAPVLANERNPGLQKLDDSVVENLVMQDMTEEFSDQPLQN
jgi:hypothetical protein